MDSSMTRSAPDDTVMTSDGLTGIVVGMDGSEKIDVLWTGFQFKVTKVNLKDVAIIKFPPTVPA